MRILRKLFEKTLSLYAKIIFRENIYVFGFFKCGNYKNIKIGRYSKINTGVYIQGRNKVIIGANVVLSARCMIFDSGLDVNKFLFETNVPHTDSFVMIEDNVWVGAGAIILPGITIGHHSVIGAGSVVINNVPPYSLVAGNPAVIKKKYA